MKISLVRLSIAAVAISLATLAWCSPDRSTGLRRPHVHLVPDGFVGRVLVVYLRADGSPLERDKNSKVFRIPASGVLLSSDEGDNSESSPRRDQVSAYYVDARGGRKKLRWFWDLQSLRTAAADASQRDDVAVFGLRSGTAPRTGTSDQLDVNYYFEYFVAPIGRWEKVLHDHDRDLPAPGDV